MKPPGIFLVFAIADGLFGADPFGGRILAAFAVGIGAAGLYRIGARLLDDRLAGLFAALLFPAYSILFDGLANKPELFAAPLLIWGLLTAIEAGYAVPRLLLGGALMGAATMLKQTAAFEILFALVLVVATRRDARAIAAFVLGLLVVPAGFALYFAAHGAFGAFVGANIVGALARLRGDGVTLAEAPTRLLASLRPAMPMLVLAGIGWAERRRVPWQGTRPGLLWSGAGSPPPRLASWRCAPPIPPMRCR